MYMKYLSSFGCPVAYFQRIYGNVFYRIFTLTLESTSDERSMLDLTNFPVTLEKDPTRTSLGLPRRKNH